MLSKAGSASGTAVTSRASTTAPDAEWTDRVARYERTAEVRVAEFGAHADDELLPD